MALETAQLLATALHGEAIDIGYRSTHVAHPCSRWTTTSRDNFSWLIEHGLELCDEYEFRFKREHASKSVIKAAFDHRQAIPDGPLAFTFNSSGFSTGDVFYDYRLCLVNKWLYVDKRKPTWRYRDPPPFKRELSTLNFNGV